MHLTLAQSLALTLFGLALTRSTTSFSKTLGWLEQAKSKSLLFHAGYVLLALVAALPEFVCSSKAIDLALMVAKG